MTYGLVLVVHILVALFLIGVILLQGGRGGLGEALGGAAAQSLFGGAVNTVMTKITAASAMLFMGTCLGLAALSTAQGRSVIDRLPATLPSALPPIPGVPPVPSGSEGMPKAEGRRPPQPSESLLPSAPVSPPSSDSAPPQ